MSNYQEHSVSPQIIPDSAIDMVLDMLEKAEKNFKAMSYNHMNSSNILLLGKKEQAYNAFPSTDGNCPDGGGDGGGGDDGGDDGDDGDDGIWGDTGTYISCVC